MIKYWELLPIWLKAIAIGSIMFLPPITLIQVAIFRNVVTLQKVPWSVIFTLIVLWLYWQLAVGKKYPFGVSEFRAKYSGINSPYSFKSKDLTTIGVSLFVFVFSVNTIGFSIFGADATIQLETLKYIGMTPTATALLLYFSLAITAGIIEEIVFRGFLQNMLIEQYGIWSVFIIVAGLFTIIHSLPLGLLLPYFIVSVAFSWVAYSSNSVIVGIVVHTSFDFIAFLFVYYGTVDNLLNSNYFFLSACLFISFIALMVLRKKGLSLLDKRVTRSNILIET